MLRWEEQSMVHDMQTASKYLGHASFFFWKKGGGIYLNNNTDYDYYLELIVWQALFLSFDVY